MDITVDSDFEGSKFIYNQKAGDRSKKHIYDYKRCVGCGICVDICPSDALELGPIPEIATGMDAPPVMIDPDSCSFCGMCAAFCPAHAMEMYFDGENILDLKDYPHLDSKISVNEDCLPCILCEKVCPQEAIKLDLRIPKKKNIAPLKEGVKGSIDIDMSKCNFCGVCADFCEALIPIERDFTSEDLVPFKDLMVDEKRCDYCKICERICPEDAIIVESEDPIDATFEIDGEIEIDEEKCIKCGSCLLICPYDAIEIEKPMEGRVEIVEANLPRCDPHGCQACVKICPAKAWYLPASPDEKIGVNDELCIYCKACYNACAYDVISVDREDVNHTPLSEASWKDEWEKAISQIKSGPFEKRDTSRALKPIDVEKKKTEEVNIPVIDESMALKVSDKLQKVSSELGKAKVRQIWEKDDIEDAKIKINKRVEA
ncbi:MAG: 4Fe-4S binding protein [Halobacteriota archaeon]|nr:4Fe-4S binding protein [Halobacteriota archaeon]